MFLNIDRISEELDDEKQDGIFAIRDEIDDINDSVDNDLEELEHLIKSSRGLLSRLDENKNSMKFTPKMAIELYDTPKFDINDQFELKFDILIESKDNQILFLGCDLAVDLEECDKIAVCRN
jgi:hypothetical protein